MTESPKRCTGGQRCQPVTLREALYCQVHHSTVRLDAIARQLGISAATLADAVNPDGDGSMLAAKHYDTLLSLTPDNLALTGYMARRQRALVYALPAEGAADTQTAKVVMEFGEFLTRHAEARADRAVTAKEAGEIEIEGRQAIAAILALIDDAKRESVTPLRAVSR